MITMRSDFCVFILTHGRPHHIRTDKALAAAGYTGAVYYVVDDEDATLREYQSRFGDSVLVFSKREIAEQFDQGDNFEDRRSVFFARNACWALAARVGRRWFAQLDDDYTGFYYRLPKGRAGRTEIGHRPILSLDRIFEAMMAFMESTDCASLAMSQGGDHVGGVYGSAAVAKLRRKAMNSFICDATRPFAFVGRINEDVNTYVTQGGRGELFFTYMSLQLDQLQTQKQRGGMTELYLDVGTYVKSFYSVMYAPASVRVAMVKNMGRIHHVIRPDPYPKILHERHRQKAVLDG